MPDQPLTGGTYHVCSDDCHHTRVAKRQGVWWEHTTDEDRAVDELVRKVFDDAADEMLADLFAAVDALDALVADRPEASS